MLVLANFTAEDIVKLFEEDVRARKRLAELLVMEPDVRLAIINAVLREVATKEDIKELRREFTLQINELRRKIDELRDEFGGRVNSLEKRFSVLEVRFSNVERRLDDYYKLMLVSLLGIYGTLITILLSKILGYVLGI